MSQKYKVVAINGSPHAGMGNTSMMVDMLRTGLEAEGIEFENIFITEKDIHYCVGCGFCLRKSKCWRNDDHPGIVDKLLAADGVILASPVYFRHVTAQMKTFLDRSLAYGHKPRPAWKPGLAVSVSAGMGETEVGAYLGGVLRCFGAFSVGVLTAIATQPGGFLGKEAVEARAADLARDLARAIKEKRRYPASDNDLFFWLFIGHLVEQSKDFMKDDYAHWKELGILDDFEKYIQQKFISAAPDEEMYDAWLKQVIASEKEKEAIKKARAETAPAKPEQPKDPADFTSCLELIKAMPKVFSPEEAGGLAAVIQFEITGGEEFTAHLAIADGKCEFGEGPATKPELVIKSPADVWLGVSKGEIDGQAAFMSGKYRTEGNLSLLMRLGKLFSA